MRNRFGCTVARAALEACAGARCWRISTLYRCSGRRSGMGFTGPSRSSDELLAEPVRSLAPSPPVHPRGDPGSPLRELRDPPSSGEPARWGESPGRSRGYGLHHRPPDVDRPACADPFVFEDLRSGRSRMRVHPSARPSWPSVPSFPTPACPSVQPVSRLDCLSWGCPKIAPPPSWQHRSPLLVSPRGVTFEMGMPAPTCVPPTWFSTTSTVSSSDTVRVCCNALPALGFIPFRARRPSRLVPPNLPRDAFPALRSLPSVRSCGRILAHVHANVDVTSVSPRDRVTCVSPRSSPLSLPPRPFPSSPRRVATVARTCVSRSGR